MALIDVVKWDMNNDATLVWKFPSDKIHTGSQLIVSAGQEAIFLRGGVVLDRFGPGTFTLTSKNLPLLDKVVNLPFGGNTPFSAEVWFVTKLQKLDLRWELNLQFHCSIVLLACQLIYVVMADGASKLKI